MITRERHSLLGLPMPTLPCASRRIPPRLRSAANEKAGRPARIDCLETNPPH